MNKNKLNFWLDIVLVILVVVAVIALLPHEINRSSPIWMIPLNFSFR
jgi:hypothetical protein